MSRTSPLPSCLPFERRHGEFLSLLALALLIPVPLYLLSLALFGFPHVIAELAYIALEWPILWMVLMGQPSGQPQK